MDNKNDILKENGKLREMPFTTPEGYFEDLRCKVAKSPERRTGSAGKGLIYAAAAASFLFLVSAGTLLLKTSGGTYEMTQEDYLMFADNMTSAIAYEMEYGSQVADAVLADEDIIDYLIYIGVTPEEIELTK